MASPFLLPYLSNLRRPAQRLSLEELLAMQDDFQPAPRPTPRRNLQDLDQGDRRDVRQQSVLEALAALGASMQTGDWRNAGAGAGRIADMERGAVDQANARSEQSWQQEQEQAAQAHQQKEKQRSAAALYGMYQRAIEGEDPEGPWARRAEAAARAGNMSELSTMASDDVKGKRALTRSKGLNPDLFGDNQKAEADLAAEIERANKAADWEAEKKRLAEKAEAENQARIALEEKMRAEKLGTYQPPDPPQYEPLERVFAREEGIQAIRDKHQRQAESVTGIHQMKDGTWAEMHRSDENHPRGWAVPLDGQPDIKGNLVSYSRGDARYIFNEDRPELGALMVVEHEPGEEGAPTIQQLTAPMPRPRPAAPAGRADAFNPANPNWKPEDSLSAVESAVGRTLPGPVRAEVLKDLRAGRKPREVVAEILRDNPQWRRR